jgi:tetratricopeptide (TPR) repeat protein
MFRLGSVFLLLVFVTLPSYIAPHACLAQTASVPQKTEKDDPQRSKAIELYDQGKYAEAMPLFEQLSANHPSDIVVREHFAWCLFQYAGSLSDAEQRKQARARARTVAVQAKALGDNSQLLELMLEQPEDGGSDLKYSDRKEVDEAMKTAETAFSRGELDTAREGYLRVLLLDPDNYEAALFAGDVYFKQHVYGSAGEWFARAIQIDGNRETAYRYWGDALAAMGKEDDARSKFIEAIIAEPYNRRTWMGMTNWLERNKAQLNVVKLKEGAAVTKQDEKNTTITLDANLFNKKTDPAGTAWMMYGIIRAGWHGDRFKKEFPNESEYRHSLREETEALSLMVSTLKKEKEYEKKSKKADPSLLALIALEEAGFLEPYILLNRADDGIAKDFEPYRVAKRDNLRRYLDEYLVPKTPTKKK